MKIDINKIKDLNQYKNSLTTFDWDELAADLIKLEEELYNLKNYLKPKEIKLLQQLITLYEQEKQSRLPKVSNFFKNMYDQRDLIAITDEADIQF